jgi:hypothetical protein
VRGGFSLDVAYVWDIVCVVVFNENNIKTSNLDKSMFFQGRENQKAGERSKCPKDELRQSWEVRGGFSLVVAYVWDTFFLLFVENCVKTSN